MPRDAQTSSRSRFESTKTHNQEGTDDQLLSHFRLNALVATVIYADLFDYALTRDEAQRYLIGVPASRKELDKLLSPATLHGRPLSVFGPYVTLPNREGLVEKRRSRAAAASRLWGHAIAYRDTLARLPFVRMIAVTGALAVNNTDEGGDIDLFLITAPGRLWLARAFVIGIVRSAAKKGITLCPNYLVTERALSLTDQNLFTAHELAQMKPIFGLAAYRRTMQCNNWLMDYLPNSIHDTSRVDTDLERPTVAKQVAESILRLPLLEVAEKWEMSRKSSRFKKMKSLIGTHGAEADFAPDWCKGHFQGHRQRTLRDFHDRLQDFGIAPGELVYAS